MLQSIGFSSTAGIFYNTFYRVVPDSWRSGVASQKRAACARRKCKTGCPLVCRPVRDGTSVDGCWAAESPFLYGPRRLPELFAQFGGDWLVCNRSTLYRYNQQGELLQTWRVGLELPAVPLAGLAVRRGIPQPELWIATDGAGSLIWDGVSFRQFRPESAPVRKTTALPPLPDGRVLFGTLTAGLYVTDTRQCSLFRDELKNAKISALAQGATTEEIWIGTRDQGVWLWRAGTPDSLHGRATRLGSAFHFWKRAWRLGGYRQWRGRV